MHLKNITPGQTITMGDSTFTVEGITYVKGQGCTVNARYADGTQTRFNRVGLTTVTVVK